METWDDLPFWESGEYDVCLEHLTDAKQAGIVVNPDRRKMFRALRETPYEQTKVVFMGQDPYPDHSKATGLAFSIPLGESFPPTLKNILKELKDDLGHDEMPPHGDLTSWAKQGVLLWNAIPTCEAGKPLSHNWVEWQLLTQQIVEALNNKPVVFAFVGGVAREFSKFVVNRPVVVASHPSPRGMMSSNNPFIGSRIFSTINAHLCKMGHTPINWRLE